MPKTYKISAENAIEIEEIRKTITTSLFPKQAQLAR